MKGFLRNLGLLVFLLVVMVGWVMLPWPGAVVLAVLIAAWLVLTRRGRQAASVANVGISTLRQRLGSSAVIVVGIAGVVGVLVALLSMAEGYSETLRKTGGTDTAIVMRGASASEVMSVLDRDSVTQVVQAQGIARDAAGHALASPELVVAANLPIKGGAAGDEGSVQLRGVGEQAWAVRPQVKIVEGRRFGNGLRELIVGRGAARQFVGLIPGHEIRLGSQTWTGSRACSRVLGRRARVRGLGRRGGRRRHLSPRQQPRVGDGAPGRSEGLRRVQGGARGQPAAQGRRQHDAGLLQQAVRGHVQGDPRDRHHRRRDHGHRRDETTRR